ncbi:serine protease inhibitor A3B-like [Grammomys surdaster]|uniref:serine protease inhibitor A3B-like n=1 Tax=Grammomys surdaster TaxID=491861 RepID=UPI0010A0525B|nr:serine protease inhibitor A3B-like [Grammomys surdaster]XP_028637884.1 serine protease inhibitor A3B-like [Grammomys surdaster]
MAIIAALGILMVGICPAVLCCSDDALGRHIAVQKDQDTLKQLDSLTLASTNTDFALSLYNRLVLQNPRENIVFSPLGITTALNSLALGAKGNTRQEILEGLKFNLTETPEADIHQSFGHLLQQLSQPEDQVQIIAGNALFVEKHLQILTEFKEKVRALYQTEVFTANFQQPHETKKFINDYVKKHTQGKLKELASDLDESTSMVVVNDLLFIGKWKVPFDPDDTFMGKFMLDRKRTVTVPMMKIENLKTPYFRDEKLKCTVVELSYIGNAKAMFILPDQGRMRQVEASLQSATLKKWRKSLKNRMIDEFYLPKFFLSQQYNLEDILPGLGIREVFSAQADLSGITGANNITVSEIIHNALLEMTETGTEVDASTRVEYEFLSAKTKPISVNMNRKFLYIVLDSSSSLISVMGKVNNPLEN